MSGSGTPVASPLFAAGAFPALRADQLPGLGIKPEHVEGLSAAIDSVTTGKLDKSGGSMTGPLAVVAPTLAAHPVRKADMDDMVLFVAAVSPANTSYSGAAAYDGYAPSLGDLIFLPKQTTVRNSGIYVWNGLGVTMTRAPGFAAASYRYANTLVVVSNGTRYGKSRWRQDQSGQVGTDSITWSDELASDLSRSTSKTSFASYLQPVSDLLSVTCDLRQFFPAAGLAFSAQSGDLTAAFQAALAALPSRVMINVPPGNWTCGPITVAQANMGIHGGVSGNKISVRDAFQPHMFKLVGGGRFNLENIFLSGSPLGNENIDEWCDSIVWVDQTSLLAFFCVFLNGRKSVNLYNGGGSRIDNCAFQGHVRAAIWVNGSETEQDGNKVGDCCFNELDIYTGQPIGDDGLATAFRGHAFYFGRGSSACYVSHIRCGSHEVAFMFEDKGVEDYGLPARGIGSFHFRGILSGICRVAGWWFKSGNCTYTSMVDCRGSAGWPERGGAGVRVTAPRTELRMIGGSLHESSKAGLWVENCNEVMLKGVRIWNSLSAGTDDASGVIVDGGDKISLGDCDNGSLYDDLIGGEHQKWGLTIGPNLPAHTKIWRMGGDWSGNTAGEVNNLSGRNPMCNEIADPDFFATTITGRIIPNDLPPYTIWANPTAAPGKPSAITAAQLAAMLPGLSNLPPKTVWGNPAATTGTPSALTEADLLAAMPGLNPSGRILRTGDTMTGALGILKPAAPDQPVQMSELSDMVQAVAAVSVANTSYTGAATYDGYAPTAGDLIFLPKQTTARNSGIYVWNGVGVGMTRAPSFANGSYRYANSLVIVTSGTRYADSRWRQRQTVKVGTDDVTWISEFSADVPAARIMGNATGAIGPAVPLTGAEVATLLPLAAPLTLRGNSTGVAALVQDLTPAQVAAMLPGKAENGSWTPGLSCATPGDLSVAYTTATATYRLSAGGGLVDIDFILVATPTYTTAAGIFYITGLPFQVANRASGGVLHLNTYSAFTWPSSGTTTSLTLRAIQATTRLQLAGHKSANTPFDMMITGFPSGAQIVLRGQGSYPVQ